MPNLCKLKHLIFESALDEHFHGNKVIVLEPVIDELAAEQRNKNCKTDNVIMKFKYINNKAPLDDVLTLTLNAKLW